MSTADELFGPKTTIFGRLIWSNNELIRRKVENGWSEGLDGLVRRTCDELAAASVALSNSHERERIFGILLFWEGVIGIQAGERYKAPTMAAYDHNEARFAELMNRSDNLLEYLAEHHDFLGFVEQAKRLCDELAEAGTWISDWQKRSRLRTKLQYWASEIRSTSGELYHAPRLAPYDRS